MPSHSCVLLISRRGLDQHGPFICRSNCACCPSWTSWLSCKNAANHLINLQMIEVARAPKMITKKNKKWKNYFTRWGAARAARFCFSDLLIGIKYARLSRDFIA